MTDPRGRADGDVDHRADAVRLTSLTAKAG